MFACCVTNITSLGSTMVNWNGRLIYPGGDTSFVVFIHALGHHFGVVGPIGDSRSQGCHEQTRLG